MSDGGHFGDIDAFREEKKHKRGGRRYASKPAPLPEPKFTPEEMAKLLREVRPDDKPPAVQPQFPTRAAEFDPSKLTDIEAEEFRAVLYEIHSRKQEALWLFEPTPTQEAFLASNADERLAIGGNPGGMTTTTMVEIARAVTSLRLASFFSLAMASTCCSVSPTEYNFSFLDDLGQAAGCPLTSTNLLGEPIPEPTAVLSVGQS